MWLYRLDNLFVGVWPQPLHQGTWRPCVHSWAQDLYISLTAMLSSYAGVVKLRRQLWKMARSGHARIMAPIQLNPHFGKFLAPLEFFGTFFGTFCHIHGQFFFCRFSQFVALCTPCVHFLALSCYLLALVGTFLLQFLVHIVRGGTVKEQAVITSCIFYQKQNNEILCNLKTAAWQEANLSNDWDGDFSFLVSKKFCTLLKKYTKHALFDKWTKNIWQLKKLNCLLNCWRIAQLLMPEV